MMQEKEPPWRVVLNYGCVLYFLGLPAMAILYGVTHLEFAPGTGVAKFLSEFHFAVTALVATMAGLNSFDRHKAMKNGKPIAEETKYGQRPD